MKVWRLFADGCSCVPSGRLRGLERVEKSQTRGTYRASEGEGVWQ